MNIDSVTLLRLLRPLIVFLLVGGGALVVRRLALVVLDRWSQRTTLRRDDTLVVTLRAPSILWAVALGLYAALEASDLPPRLLTPLGVALRALLILSVTLVAANLTTVLINQYGARHAVLLPVTGLTQAFARAVVLVLGALVLLGSVGIAITPLLTALGVGGLAVALALTDTLKNLFAGMHILADRPIRMGDYVRLESGEEGYVQDIGWRSTRVRTRHNVLVIVPNAKLAESILSNYSVPALRLELPLRVRLSPRLDLDQVETILVEEAMKAGGQARGLLDTPPPFVRLSRVSGSSVDVVLACHVSSFEDQEVVRHELCKRIFRRLHQEGGDLEADAA